MKKILLTIFSLAMAATSAMAQSSGDPFKWELGDNASLKLGGFVRFTTSLDIEGSVTGNDFVTSSIPVTTPYTDESRLIFDPSATRFSLEFMQKGTELGDIKVYVESDFRAAGNSLRLRQAYVDMCGVTAGFAWSFMSDLPASAPTIDINGSPSRTFLRTTLVGYRHTISDNLSAGISAEYPIFNTVLDAENQVNQNIPDIPAYIQYKSAKGHLKLAGVLTSMQYREDSEIEKRSTTFGYGAQLSGSYNLCTGSTIYGQAIYGRGIGRYVSAYAASDVNLWLIDEAALGAVPMGGLSAGYSGKINKEWSLAASYSFSTYDSHSQMGISRIYGHNSYASATIFYNPAKRVTLGAELLSGTRKINDSAPGSATRFSLMVKYTL